MPLTFSTCHAPSPSPYPADSDPSTPGGSLKRLPIFEALIHDERGHHRSSSAGPTAPTAGSEAGRRSSSFDSVTTLSAC